MSRKYQIGVRYRRSRAKALRRGILGAAILLLVFNFVFDGPKKLPNSTVNASNQKLSLLASSTEEPTYGLPIRLKIPRIMVDANITYLGLTKSGDMAAPSSVLDAGWYKHGASPGNPGSAVMAGHFDGPKGEPGIFANLSKLQPGDNLLIVDNKAQTVTFKVREARIYDQTDRPKEVFYSSDGAHLNLITCAGAWDKNQHNFQKRLVVFADKV